MSGLSRRPVPSSARTTHSCRADAARSAAMQRRDSRHTARNSSPSSAACRRPLTAPEPGLLPACTRVPKRHERKAVAPERAPERTACQSTVVGFHVRYWMRSPLDRVARSSVPAVLEDWRPAWAWRWDGRSEIFVLIISEDDIPADHREDGLDFLDVLLRHGK